MLIYYILFIIYNEYLFRIFPHSTCSCFCGNTDVIFFNISGSLSAVYLEKRIEEYVHEKTGQRIKFDSSEAIRILKELGIMSEDYNSHLHVLSLDAAMRNLPLTAQSLVARFEEYDVVEGYDRSIYDEKESEYKEEEKKRRKYGWF